MLVLGLARLALAQVEVPHTDTPPAGEDSAIVTDEGVPEEAVEAEQGVAEVQKAIEKVEDEIDEGLPDEFMIEFGDVWDWIRLNSGEWLKGHLKRMRDDEIDFDSDKLDVVTFDWADVVELHSPNVNIYVFDDKLDVVGRAVVTKKTVLVETAAGVEEYPREALLSIIEGAPRERNWWSMKLGVGFSANSGNTNQGSATAYFQLMRADYRTRTRLRYDGTIGYANREQNVFRHLGDAVVRLYLSRRWFFTPLSAEFLNDRFQNIRFRATPGTGAGLHLFDTKRWDWDLSTGLGYQYLEFLSTAAGVKNPQSDGFVAISTWAELEFYKDVKLELEWRTNFAYPTIGYTNHTGRAKFTVEITEIFDFSGEFLFLRTENPPPRADGTEPAKNDYQFIVSVALDID